MAPDPKQIQLQQLLEAAKKRLETNQKALKEVLSQLETLESIGAPIVELERTRARRDRLDKQVRAADELISSITKAKK